MKKSVLLVTLLILTGGVAQASYIGAVSTEKRIAQFSPGGGVSYVRTTLGIGDSQVETAQTQFFGQFSFDVKGWQIDAGGGVTDWSMKDPGAYVQGDIQSGMLPFVRASFGGPIFRGQVLTVAPFAQASYYRGFDQRITLPDADIFPPPLVTQPVYAQETMEFDDILEGVAALRFQVTIEGAHLYAGPAYFWMESKVKSSVYSYDSALPANTVNWSTTNNLSARDFGGILGIRWELPTGWRLDLEGQWRKGATYTGALSYPF